MMKTNSDAPPTDPYKFDYKTYMMETYKLEESPSICHDSIIHYDTPHMNNYEAIKIEKQSEMIGYYEESPTLKYRIYQTIEDGETFIDLLQDDKPYVLMIHSFSEIELNGKNGMETHNIWNCRNMRGLARRWIFDKIAKKYDFMMSDQAHTPKGKVYWEQIIREGIDKKMNVGVIDIKNNNLFTPINDVTLVDNYYGDNKQRYRLIIYFK